MVLVGHLIFAICMALGWALGWISAIVDWALRGLWAYVNYVNATFKLGWDDLLARILEESEDE